jgi:hypothetical protein
MHLRKSRSDDQRAFFRMSDQSPYSAFTGLFIGNHGSVRDIAIIIRTVNGHETQDLRNHDQGN